jgi:spore maturation protein CgeB
MSEAGKKILASAAAQYKCQPLKSVVAVGEFNSTAMVSYFGEAARRMNWDVVEIESSRFLGSSGNKYVDFLMGKFSINPKIHQLADHIEKVALTMGPDYVLFVKTMGATPNLLRKLGSYGIKTVAWYPDVNFDHQVVDKASIPLFDLFVTTKAFHLPYLAEIREGRPSTLIEHGYSPQGNRRLDPPVPPAERPFDCIFMGNHSAYKESWLRTIVSKRPGLRFAVVGGRWAGLDWIRQHDVYCTSVGLTGDAMSRLINHARIAIAIHHGPTGGEFDWQDEISARTFEIPATGTFMLHIDSDHVRQLYDVCGEIDVFSTPEQAITKIDYYLAHPQEREAMADRAYRRTLADYSYLDRGRDLAVTMTTMLS